MASLREGYDTVMAKIAILKRAIVNLASTLSQEEASCVSISKLKVLKRKKFEGILSTKEVNNFLWDMEAYFTHAKVKSINKVSMATMYLSNDAKLWWWTRVVDDAEEGCPKVETWEVFCKELCDQFLPCNIAWVARDSKKFEAYWNRQRVCSRV